MAGRNNGKSDVGGWLALAVIGGLFLVVQDVVKDETESWLKRNGLWPK